MKDLDIFDRIPSLNYYLKNYLNDLYMASDNGDVASVAEIFNKIESKLENNRKLMSNDREKSKIMWHDPKTHFILAKMEEYEDLTNELQDRLDLFKIASICNYEKMIEFQFAKIIQIYADIRKIRSDTTHRDKLMWDDPEGHFYRVKAEEDEDKRKEISDLFELYEIAKSANYIAGMELISTMLGIDQSISSFGSSLR